ncbi:MAG: hypothetical protein R3242_05170 [Akkermansiaceae bacterium]|nr:hypothetical protein [Akkermansiaceae bacterium]
MISCERNDGNRDQEPANDQAPSKTQVGVTESAYGLLITEEILANTILFDFSFEDQDLNVVLQYLSEESEKYAKKLGYDPVRFRAEESLGKSKVNLSAKGNSMRLLCEMLAEQTQAELRINSHEVIFARGVWDGIE